MSVFLIFKIDFNVTIATGLSLCYNHYSNIIKVRLMETSLNITDSKAYVKILKPMQKLYKTLYCY